MSAGITLSCDGHRSGQPCRGALHTRGLLWFDAEKQAATAGWRLDVDGSGDLCPSAGHDEDRHADDRPGP